MAVLSRAAFAAFVLLQLFIPTVNSEVNYQDLQYRDYVDQLTARQGANHLAVVGNAPRAGLRDERAAILEARDAVKAEIEDLLARMIATEEKRSPPNGHRDLQYREFNYQLIGRNGDDGGPLSSDATTPQGEADHAARDGIEQELEEPFARRARKARDRRPAATEDERMPVRILELNSDHVSFVEWMSGNFPKRAGVRAAKQGLAGQIKLAKPEMAWVTRSHLVILYREGTEWVPWHDSKLLQDLGQPGTVLELRVIIYATPQP